MLAGRVREAVADDGIRVVETDAATGSLAFGVLRKYIAFPRDLAERYDEDERDLALAHERGHHARGDLIGNRSEEHTYELQSLMRQSYAVFCFKKKKRKKEA